MSDETFRLAGVFLAIVVPCLLIALYSMFGVWVRHREKMTELEARITAEKAAQYAAHTERLEQRVRVIERIVTDKGIDLSDEIEQLRKIN